MRPELRFRAGSLTKSLVAAVVLRLAAKAGCRWPTPGALAARDPALRRPGQPAPAAQPHRRRAPSTAALKQTLYTSRQGHLLGNAGGIPGFLSIVLSTPDGHCQVGLMINALLAPAPVYQAFLQGARTLGSQLLS